MPKRGRPAVSGSLSSILGVLSIQELTAQTLIDHAFLDRGSAFSCRLDFGLG